MPKRFSISYTAIGCLFSAAVFTLDLVTPSNFGVIIIPHLIAVVIAAGDRSHRGPWLVAGIAVAATLVGYLIKAPEMEPDWLLANRLGFAALLFVTAVVATKLTAFNEFLEATRTADNGQVKKFGNDGLVNSIIENVPVGFLIKDANHVIVRVNDTYLDWYGMKREDIVGIPSHEIIGFQSNNDAEAMYAQERETLAKGTTSTRHVERPFADGRVHAVSITKFPIFDTAGRIVQVGSVTVDQTEEVEARRALETHEHLLSCIVDELPVGVVVKDRDNRRVLVNRTNRKWYNRKYDDILGKTYAKVFSSTYVEDAEVVAQEQEVIASGNPISRETIRRFADGTDHHLFISKYPVRDQAGDITGTVSVSVDLTEQIDTRRALETQKSLLNSIVDNLPLALVVKDTEGRRTLVNAAYCKWYGAEPEDILGKTHRETRGEADADISQAQEQQAIASGEIISREAVRLFADGKERNLLISKAPIYDNDGKVTGVASVSVDLTEQVAARRAQADSEERFKDFAEISADWMWEMDADLRFTYFSERNRDITGFDHSTFIGKTRREVAAEASDQEIWRAHFEDLDARRAFRNFEYSLKTSTGESLTVRISGKPVFDEDGNFLGYRGTGTDISEQQKIQAARREALEAAEKANRAKSEFLATMSHEFRTPLNAILGFSDILANQYLGAPESGKYVEYAGDIHDSAAHLLALVNDLLDISAIEAGKMTLEPEPLPVADLLADCTNTVAKNAAAKSIAITTEKPETIPPIFADRRAIKQVVLNLLSNAVKFTPPNGRVFISVSVDDKGHNIRITDTGPGIPPDRLKEIINPFTRGDDPYKTDKGWGLGLSISNSLVELHGGNLTIDSTVGAGTTAKAFFPFEHGTAAT